LNYPSAKIIFCLVSPRAEPFFRQRDTIKTPVPHRQNRQHEIHRIFFSTAETTATDRRRHQRQYSPADPGGFSFEVNNGKLTVVATDLETVMRIQLDVEARESGRVCIPAKILLDSLKNIADQPLTFTIDKNFGIEITSDNGKYKVMGENPDNFPKEPAADDTTSFTMPSSALVTAINKTLFAVSNDDLRPAMTGVFFELNKEFIQFVATDAHRLVRYKRTDVSCPQNDSFIVPRKPLNLLKSALPDNEDELTINYNSNHLFVRNGTTQLSCRLIDARFPDYKVVIPADNPYKLSLASRSSKAPSAA
jgi:DNA polymerase-3 subunit beta